MVSACSSKPGIRKSMGVSSSSSSSTSSLRGGEWIINVKIEDNVSILERQCLRRLSESGSFRAGDDFPSASTALRVNDLKANGLRGNDDKPRSSASCLKYLLLCPLERQW